MEVIGLSPDFSGHAPAFASYDGPSIRWVKRLAFDRAGGQEITTTLHVGTHLDAPAPFLSCGQFIGALLVIPTGYHRFYPENWTDRSAVDETRYFIRHPGPTRAFAEWVLERGVGLHAVDAGSADHPMNTLIRRLRPAAAEAA